MTNTTRIRRLCLALGVLLLTPPIAQAEDASVTLSYDAGTTTRFPLPFPSGTVATGPFTSYTGSAFPFFMQTFRVGTTGDFSVTVTGIGGGVGVYVIEGTFAPSSGSDPVTPLANVLAGTQAPATIPSITLQAGVEYTALVVVSAGSGTGTVTVSGAGCIAMGLTTCPTSWAPVGDGDWDTPANWTFGEPTATDEVSISNGGTALVTTAGNVAADVHVGLGAGGDGTLDINGGSLTTGAVDVGTTGSGTLTLRNGGALTATSLELGGSGGTGVVNVGTGGTAGVLNTNVTTGAAPGTATLNFNHSNDITFGNTISGGVTVNKLGGGSLTLTGANTHTSTVVQAGSLLVNGAQPTSNVTLQGGLFGGTGSAGSLGATGGTVAPGLSPGLLTVGAATFDAATTFFIELDGPGAGIGYDQLVVLGGVTLGNATLSGSAGAAHAEGSVFIIIDKQSGGPVSGTFNGLAEGAGVTIGGQAFQISYVGGDGNDVVLTAAGTPALAPGTLPAMTVGAPFTVTFTATGGVAPHTFAVSAGTLPDGLALTAATGVLAGTPTTAGPFSFTITGTDSLGATDVQAYSGTVAAPVPSLPFWGFAALAALLGITGFARLRAAAG